jgi:hypothetical protein
MLDSSANRTRMPAAFHAYARRKVLAQLHQKVAQARGPRALVGRVEEGLGQRQELRDRDRRRVLLVPRGCGDTRDKVRRAVLAQRQPRKVGREGAASVRVDAIAQIEQLWKVEDVGIRYGICPCLGEWAFALQSQKREILKTQCCRSGVRLHTSRYCCRICGNTVRQLITPTPQIAHCAHFSMTMATRSLQPLIGHRVSDEQI